MWRHIENYWNILWKRDYYDKYSKIKKVIKIKKLKKNA